MKVRIIVLTAFLCAGMLCLQASAQQGGTSGCNPLNGNRFNLEARSNALVQVAQSVAMLPDRAGHHNVDLLVATGIDARGSFNNPNAVILSADAYYVQRSGNNCAAEFEGGMPVIGNTEDQFIPFGTPTVAADAANDAFFIADVRLGALHNFVGVGVIKATAANLLNTTNCPNGTHNGAQTISCWTLGAVTHINPQNSFIFNPHLVVDQRKTGKGAGDLYVATTVSDANAGTSQIFLNACTNFLNCGSSALVSGVDSSADNAWVQMRPDGGITVSYENQPTRGAAPTDIKFVNCTPGGAPNPPSCGTAVLVASEKKPLLGTVLGDVATQDVTYPRHANRVEGNSKTVTTFLVYDRCEVPLIGFFKGVGVNCPKTDVVLTSSQDGGNTWSPIVKVTNKPGQQFFANVATDDSTGTVNIGYYSTQNDPAFERPQVFLAQVAPGSTTIGTTQQLTTAFSDVQATTDLFGFPQPGFGPTGEPFGDRIGIAAGGSGIAGQSHAYVGFTSNNVSGVYSGVNSPDINNHLTRLDY
jgi:hypothetical protein